MTIYIYITNGITKKQWPFYQTNKQTNENSKFLLINKWCDVWSINARTHTHTLTHVQINWKIIFQLFFTLFVFICCSLWITFPPYFSLSQYKILTQSVTSIQLHVSISYICIWFTLIPLLLLVFFKIHKLYAFCVR